MEMERLEREFKKNIEDNLSQANYFSCVILYENYEDLAWYTALRIGEMIINYFESKLRKRIDIHLILKINKIILKLKEMKENDIVLLTIDDENIRSLTSYIISETLGKKKNLIFISKEENHLSRPFKDITGVVINVNSLNEVTLNCVIEISEKGKRELKLKLPNKSLINEYHDLKAVLLKEWIRKQVPELEDQK
jgi:hypothetical protein